MSKQFLLMVEENFVVFLKQVIPGIQFVEVQGMDMKDTPTHRLLANPVPEPEVQLTPAETVADVTTEATPA